MRQEMPTGQERKEKTMTMDDFLAGFRAGLKARNKEGEVAVIVRCKDCRWMQDTNCVRFADVKPYPHDFCSRGERREECTKVQ